MGIKKAMVFAAGLGTRLRPLTEHLPKPLVPLLNEPLLHYHIKQLVALGIEQVAINLHHLPDLIAQYAGNGERWGVELSYSYEHPQILGTAGGLARLCEFFEQESLFIVINGDILHQIDLSAVVKRHIASGAVASLVVLPHPGDPNIGAIGVDCNGRVLRVPEMPWPQGLHWRMYTGIQIATPVIFDYLKPLPPPPSCILRTAYRRMLEDGLYVDTHLVHGLPWCDIGTPETYLSANFDLLDSIVDSLSQYPQLEGIEILPPVCVGKNVEIGQQSVIGPYAIIGDDTKIGAGNHIRHSIIWHNCVIADHTELEYTICFDNKFLELNCTNLSDKFR
jgi:NDP-sugar pyrophosphorylase family protein